MHADSLITFMKRLIAMQGRRCFSFWTICGSTIAREWLHGSRSTRKRSRCSIFHRICRNSIPMSTSMAISKGGSGLACRHGQSRIWRRRLAPLHEDLGEEATLREELLSGIHQSLMQHERFACLVVGAIRGELLSWNLSSRSLCR